MQLARGRLHEKKKKEKKLSPSFPFRRPFLRFCEILVILVVIFLKQTHQERQGLVGSGADGLVDGGFDLYEQKSGCMREESEHDGSLLKERGKGSDVLFC